MFQEMLYFSQKNKMKIFLFVLLLLLILPFASDAKKRTKIYVDASASGTEIGTSSHPYKTIAKALEHADKNNQVFIRKGTYRENITIPNGVQVVGASKKDVIIEAANKGRSVVKMDNKTELVQVTVRKGKNGIKVNSGDRASINKCIIKDNFEDGIMIEGGKTSKDDRVVITNSEIKNNGKDGIFSDKRKVVVMDNEISKNDGDGIDLNSGAFGWIKNNDIEDNDKSGLIVELDGSDVSIIKNTFKDNGREGVQIESFGRSGKVDISRSKFTNNKNFGIARIQRGNFPSNIWSRFSVAKDNIFKDNRKGNLSGILTIFK